MTPLCEKCIHNKVCEYMIPLYNLLEQLKGLHIKEPFRVDIRCRYYAEWQIQNPNNIAEVNKK